MSKYKTTILCSGVALGVYIPAILVEYKLRNNGIPTDIVVIENLLKDEKISRIADNKKIFHKNFRIALTGQKMATDLFPVCDTRKINDLFELWINENRRNFIIFSGFWMSIVSEYMKRLGDEKLNIDIIHMDAAISASWKHFSEESLMHNNIWLFSGESKKLNYEISVSEDEPIPFRSRNNRYVIHGGGWGMGTYQGVIPELEENHLHLDIVAYDIEETLEGTGKDNRYYMIDPGWSPWLKNINNRHEFPPFGEIKKNEEPVFMNREEYHELYDVIRRSNAIISKPGGATLLDSLSSATPLIMLDPFGDYEKNNAELWECLEFGIPYEKWKADGYSFERLELIHNNLLKRRDTHDYVEDYIKRNLSRCLN